MIGLGWGLRGSRVGLAALLSLALCCLLPRRCLALAGLPGPTSLERPLQLPVSEADARGARLRHQNTRPNAGPEKEIRRRGSSGDRRGRKLLVDPSAAADSPDPCQPGICTEVTRTASGLCAWQFFQAYDQAYRDEWPGRVDLLVRSHLGPYLLQLEYLWHSIDLLWPRNIGDFVIVLDDDLAHRMRATYLPARAKVIFEKNPLRFSRRILEQWSYFWADKYTTAPFVAIVSEENLFISKVVPSLLFNMTEGKPYLVGIKYEEGVERQQHIWKHAVDFFLGPEFHWGNFIGQMPFVFPRGVLREFREFVQTRHRKGFDQLLDWWSQHGHHLFKDHIFQTTLGNFMRNFSQDKIHLVQENSDHTPIPRVAVAMPYTKAMVGMTLARLKGSPEFSLTKFQLRYVTVADAYTSGAVCAAFPPEAGLCRGVQSLSEDNVIWSYMYDWREWGQIYKAPTVNSTSLYDTAKGELHCLYKEYMSRCGSGDRWKPLSEQCMEH